MTKRDEQLTAVPAGESASIARPEIAGAHAAGGSQPRKAYRAPSVQKRRSLVHATLVSGGGTGGALAGGAP